MRLLALLMTLMWPTLSPADEARPSLPALYQVSDVAEDDVLNIRAAPDASSSILGSFSHDASDIEVVELSLSGQWARVNIAEQSGWVSLRFLKLQRVETGFAGLPAGLTCFGTEPSWDMQLTDQGLVLAQPNGRQTFPITFTAPLADNVNLGESGFLFTWDAGESMVHAHILPGRCNDGMSDRVYGLHYVDTYLPNAGCCSL